MSHDQERHFRSILDKGLDLIIKDDSEDLSPDQFSIRSASKMSYEVARPQVGNLKDELSSLQDKIAALENRLHRESPTEEKPRHAAKRPSLSPRRAKASPKQLRRGGSSQKLLENIAKSEQELVYLESSLTRSPKTASTPYESEGKAGEVGRLHKLNSQLKREAEDLRKKLREKENLQTKFMELKQDFNAITLSFERSEQIRRKQKAIIEQLKAAVAAEDPGQQTLTRPVVGKRRKIGQRSGSQRALIR
jgi:chromosome segregation ATPase